MKQLLEILAVLSLTTASGTLGIVNQINQKNISDQQKDKTDLKDLLAGKLFLGSFLTPEEAKSSAEDLLKIVKLDGKVKIGEPKEGNIHLTATDEGLTGEVNLTYHIIQDIKEILKNKLNLGYARSDFDAKVKAFYNLEKAKIKSKVLLGEPKEGKIHVQANFPNLKGDADFEYKISQEINKLLAGLTELGSVNDDDDAWNAGQVIIDRLGLQDKVTLDEAMGGKIKVILNDSSLWGYATFTYSIIPWLSDIITITDLGILDDDKEGTILAKVEELNPEAKNKVKVESIGQEKKTAVIIANSPKDYQGDVQVQFKAKMAPVEVNPPGEILVTLTKTTKDKPVLDPEDAAAVKKAVIETMQTANAERNYNEQTFKVDASKLAPTANEISVKVEATPSTPEKPGLIAKDNLLVKLDLTTANFEPVPAKPAKQIVLTLKDTTDGETIHDNDIVLVQNAIIAGMKEANKERVVKEDTFTVDVNDLKKLIPGSSSVSVHVNPTNSTVDQPGLKEGNTDVSLNLTGVKLEIVATLTPNTIFPEQTSVLHIEHYSRFKNPHLNYDEAKISIGKFNDQGNANIKILQNVTENIEVPIEISADNAIKTETVKLNIKKKIVIDANLDISRVYVGKTVTLTIYNYASLTGVEVNVSDKDKDLVDIGKIEEIDNGKGQARIKTLKKGEVTITITADNVEKKDLKLAIIEQQVPRIEADLKPSKIDVGGTTTLTIHNYASLTGVNVSGDENFVEKIGKIDEKSGQVIITAKQKIGTVDINITADNAPGASLPLTITKAKIDISDVLKNLEIYGGNDTGQPINKDKVIEEVLSINSIVPTIGLKKEDFEEINDNDFKPSTDKEYGSAKIFIKKSNLKFHGNVTVKLSPLGTKEEQEIIKRFNSSIKWWLNRVKKGMNLTDIKALFSGKDWFYALKSMTKKFNENNYEYLKVCLILDEGNNIERDLTDDDLASWDSKIEPYIRLYFNYGSMKNQSMTLYV